MMMMMMMMKMVMMMMMLVRQHVAGKAVAADASCKVYEVYNRRDATFGSFMSQVPAIHLLLSVPPSLHPPPPPPPVFIPQTKLHLSLAWRENHFVKEGLGDGTGGGGGRG